MKLRWFSARHIAAGFPHDIPARLQAFAPRGEYAVGGRPEEPRSAARRASGERASAAGQGLAVRGVTAVKRGVVSVGF